MLHGGKAEQHDNEDEATSHGGLGDVVTDLTRDHQPAIEQPGDQDDPGGHQQHRAVIAAQGQQQDQEEAGNAEQRQHEAGNGGGNRGLEESERKQREEQRRQPQGQMDEAQMPSMQVQIDKQEPRQGGGYARLRRGSERLHAARRDAQQTSHDAKIDQEIRQCRPGKRGGRGKHTAALDHKHDGEEHGGERGNAQHNAAEQRERVHVSAVGVGFPEIQFGQGRAGQLGNKGHGRAGIERDFEHIGFAIGEAHRTNAGAGGQRLDAFGAEIGLKHAGAGQPEKRRHQQTLDLLIALIAQREQAIGRVGALLARQHLDAADDAVLAGRGRQLHAAIGARLDFHHGGQIDGIDVFGDRDDFKRGGGCEGNERERKTHREGKEVTHQGRIYPAVGFFVAVPRQRTA